MWLHKRPVVIMLSNMMPVDLSGLIMMEFATSMKVSKALSTVRELRLGTGRLIIIVKTWLSSKVNASTSASTHSTSFTIELNNNAALYWMNFLQLPLNLMPKMVNAVSLTQRPAHMLAQTTPHLVYWNPPLLKSAKTLQSKAIRALQTLMTTSTHTMESLLRNNAANMLNKKVPLLLSSVIIMEIVTSIIASMALSNVMDSRQGTSRSHHLRSVKTTT